MGPAVLEHRGLARLWSPYGQHSFPSCLEVAVKLSAILEEHAQRVLHPEWAAPAVLEDCGLVWAGAGARHVPGFQSHTSFIMKRSAILEPCLTDSNYSRLIRGQ